MNCAIKLKGYEVAGSTFQDRKFIFTDRDISGDVFTAVVYNSFSKKNEIEGLKVGNEVFFPYSTLENLKTGRYRIEFWATLAGIGKEMIALEEFFVSSDPSCTNGSNETNVSITFKEEVINFTIQTALMYGGALKWENVEDKPEEFPPSAHVHQWSEIEDKPTVFYDDTGIKEEIAEKVDKVEGKSLSTNDFTDADKTKLDNLENYNDEDLLAEIEKRVLKKDGWDLSQNNFTTGEKNKLAGLDGNKFFGKFANETALSALVGVIGAYAYVGGVGRNDESYIWDDDDLKWVKSNNIPTAETPASVKTKYESNPDTNAFTNARRDKLNNAVVASDLLTANVGSATKLQTARTFTLGNTGKNFDGSGNITWTLSEIGAQSVADMGNYVLQTSLNSQLTSYVLQSNLNTQLQSYATLNGVQTFNGTKTFTEAPIVPNGTLNGHAVNLGQLNAKFLPYTGANQDLNLGTNNLVLNGAITGASTIGSSGYISTNGGFGTTDKLVRDIVATRRVHGIPYTNLIYIAVNNTLDQVGMGDIIIDLFRFSGRSLKLILTSYKYSNDWYFPSIYLSHGDIDDITKIRLLKESNSRLWIEITTTNSSQYMRTVISEKFSHSWSLNTYNIFYGSEVDTTSFTVSATILGTSIINKASTAIKLQTARTFTLGNTSKSFDGSENLTWTLSEIGAQSVWVQNKLSANLTLSANNTRQTIIATANRTVTVPTGLSDDFECTFIADGGTITFANSGTVFKFNNSKVLLASGGIATLRKENGTNNFYLKGDLT